MNAPLGFLFPDQAKPPKSRRSAAVYTQASGPTLSCHERLMMKEWETAMWLDRREIAALVVARPPHALHAFVAAIRQFVVRMQLGPVGRDDQTF